MGPLFFHLPPGLPGLCKAGVWNVELSDSGRIGRAQQQEGICGMMSIYLSATGAAVRPVHYCVA